jgi:predicted nuclease with TOPRIM domain
MHLSAISLFELGQFLRIFLWIFLPIFILTVLITSYAHYRKRGKKKEQGVRALPLAIEGDDETVAARIYSDVEARPEDGNTAYRGLLWLKGKYERERERSTAKYMQLKEENRQLKDKYEELEDHYKKAKAGGATSSVSGAASTESGATSSASGPVSIGSQQPPAQVETGNGVTNEELIERSSLKDQLAEKNLQVAFLQNQLDQRINNYHQLEHQGREAKEKLAEWEIRHPQTQELLNERQTTIDGLREQIESLREQIDHLREQLQLEIRKTTEVRTKLESGGNLLLKIHQELDQLLTKDAANLPTAEVGDVNHITAWAQSEDAAPALNHFAW